ncbi:unnamed protein product [Trichogramma brassicae]|uniref:RNA-directed DNA polymerase n=1 Tax=Trichogramma brassicae TaxID=86971 RepID=A0A6H5INI1_9HYME|nr:unnamed protein product [Trichogramma brassicae]
MQLAAGVRTAAGHYTGATDRSAEREERTSVDRACPARAFEEVKTALNHPLRLARPLKNEKYILQTDASSRGMGAVLFQQPEGEGRRIIAYASAQIFSHREKYHCNEQECLAVETPEDLGDTRAHLATYTESSRRRGAGTVHWASSNRGPTRYDPRRPAQRSASAGPNHERGYRKQGELIWGRPRKGTPWRLYVPTAIRPESFCDSTTTQPKPDTRGRTRLTRALQRHFYWRGMQQDVRSHIRDCNLCGRVKKASSHPAPISSHTPTEPWKHVALDLMGHTPPQRSNIGISSSSPTCSRDGWGHSRCEQPTPPRSWASWRGKSSRDGDFHKPS